MPSEWLEKEFRPNNPPNASIKEEANDEQEELSTEKGLPEYFPIQFEGSGKHQYQTNFEFDRNMPDAEQIPHSRRGPSRRATQQVQPEIPKEKHHHARQKAKEILDDEEEELLPDQVKKENLHDRQRDRDESGCRCQSLYCECPGCSHSEQVKQLNAETRRKWGSEQAQEQTCGSGCQQQKCSCLPGLHCCNNCHTHSKKSVEGQDSYEGNLPRQKCQCQSSNCQCNDCPEHIRAKAEYGPSSEELVQQSDIWVRCSEPPPDWQDQFPDGELVWAKDGKFSIQSGLNWGMPRETIERFDKEIVPGRPDMSREERSKALFEFHRLEMEEENRWRGQHARSEEHDPKSAEYKCKDFAYIEAQAFSCIRGSECACSPGTCKCGDRQHEPPSIMVEEPGEIRPNKHDASFPQPQQVTRLCQEEDVDRTVTSNLNTGGPCPEHLQLPELMSESSTQSSSRVGTSIDSVRQGSNIFISRPDTPRPPATSVPSTPYASDVLQDHIQQSVEPKLPRPNWLRGSTPAYEDRSLTPSPISRRGADVAMRDVLGEVSPPAWDREESFPPATLQSESRMKVSPHTSPKKPVLPPIPTGTSPLKQPKRGDRRKSGVQGAKVDKRSVTGSTKPTSTPTSRNVARTPTAVRQPTSSVGKLVERAQKVVGEDGGKRITGAGKGKAKAGDKAPRAVEEIEKQIRRQEEEEYRKQKDGTPVRRSARANKGVRTSTGSLP
ncbi:uncharacterized protein Z518_04428 [Rhinocladiella mackenziei CBS 650.93]|uniref:Uncharacterized protein n=1 Tax=Rhinocladiella mackenziei CBS 650.93 TaxID=1442369 RepID=A0A0D2FWB0_9EURO|nr:uncharacterized protein Z518_04428 [Rhinocladiella mackenziei CBS 650.93]KIX06452.1 hypothetical protein Z518_04428 [Rhinocladiella mackenziei CBS 650.93]